MFKSVVNFILLMSILNSFVSANLFDAIIFSNVPESGRLNITEKALKYGLGCDEHTVTTEDGYNLLLFNIKGDKSKPVFLMHGITDSGDVWAERDNISIAITLGLSGYDVWIGNHRGCKYSRTHVSLDTQKDKVQYWNFTVQELAVYDLAAMIDYVLNKTGQKQLKAIGHSQGTTVFYILGAERPEYNQKIKLLISLAPICYLNHIKGLAKTLLLAAPLLIPLLELLGQHELFAPPLLDLKTFICSQNTIGYEVCAKGFLFPLSGSDPEELEPEMFRALVGRFPDTAGVMNLNHFVQIGNRMKFSKYDFGLLGNLEKYGGLAPLDYALKNVSMPIALISGKNDNLSTLEDVKLLMAQLPNVVYSHVMEREQFSHFDFVFGKHLPEYLFPIIFDLLAK